MLGSGGDQCQDLVKLLVREMDDVRLARGGLVAVVLLLTLGLGFAAQAVKASDTFSFRRIGLPQGDARRITVQIALGTDALAGAAEPDLIEGPSSTGAASEWFWLKVPAGIHEASGAARFAAAMRAIEVAGASVGGPRLALLQKIADSYGPLILRETVGTRVSPALVMVVIATESSGRADAISSAGASGLMQLMPDTAARFGVTDPSDPSQNIHGGVAYLNWLIGEFAGDGVLALAGYNAGEGAVRRHLGVPTYAETRDYVPKVLLAWSVARRLCATPPELLGDGCVFALRTAAAQ